MIMTYTINSSIEIHSLKELYKLKYLQEEANLKINKSQIARELSVDRRTVDKYMNGYIKSATRNRSSHIDEYYDLIKELLSEKNPQVFFYKKTLWQYLKDNHGLKCAQSSFRRWILQHKEFNSYFNGKTNRTVNGQQRNCSTNHKIIHYETPAGEEAQLDWKEDMNFLLKDGTEIDINIFSLVYSYSRFKVNFLSLTKKREALMHYLDQAFETAGGVPQRLKTDNMKTVMDEARTEYKKGKVNRVFQQFADDYGFEVYPCVAGHPWSKGKVENPMKLWDELYAYNGTLDYCQLHEKVKELNNRLNSTIHTETGRIPILHIKKEKDSLQALPRTEVRNQYKIVTTEVKVNSQSVISYKSNKYSVPPVYIGRKLQLQIYDDYLHLYSNTKLVSIHQISQQKWNYHKEDYQKIYEMAFRDDNEKIKDIAKENLRNIGELYNE